MQSSINVVRNFRRLNKSHENLHIHVLRVLKRFGQNEVKYIINVVSNQNK